MEAELTVAFLAFTEQYTSRVTCVPYESVKVRFPFSIFRKASLFSVLIDCVGSSVLVGLDHEQAVAESATPLFKSLETTWRFHPASSTHQSNDHPASSTTPSRSELALAPEDVGPTAISLSLSFAFANPVHAAVSGAFFGRVSGLMVKAFEERCSKVYGC
jgi:coenzyme Q-binding protein COQ10